MPRTHAVRNQPPPLQDYNVFDADVALTECLSRSDARWAIEEARALGEVAGSADAIENGRLANAYPPVLKTYDRFGNRVDEVEYHPAYHETMKLGVASGLHQSPWTDPRPGAHTARAVKFMVWSQIDAGPACPISMTYSAVPALRVQPSLAQSWEPLIHSTSYDPQLAPPHTKSGVLFGMAMTEKQGGSDVRANSTQARPIAGGGPGQEYELVGHKWFCSAPMSDAFLVLAYSPEGLSCFLMPRVLADGSRNHFHIQRLKDKLGNRSNASSEVEFEGALAYMVGEEGRGVRTIIEMVNHTRLDCVIGSATAMRQAVAHATHHSAHRKTFGSYLSDHPLMRNVLADLAVESEAATLTAMRLAQAYDSSEEIEAMFRRLATAVAKFWVCKRTSAHAAEALECFGGNGFVEESGMPRLYREAPLNSIWEGSGNVICLDVLRALAKQPEVLEVFMNELSLARGAHQRYDAWLKRLEGEPVFTADAEQRARVIVSQLALGLQACLLLRHGHPAVAEAFCNSRLSAERGLTFGELDSGTDFSAIIDRATPKIS